MKHEYQNIMSHCYDPQIKLRVHLKLTFLAFLLDITDASIVNTIITQLDEVNNDLNIHICSNLVRTKVCVLVLVEKFGRMRKVRAQSLDPHLPRILRIPVLLNIFSVTVNV